MSDENPSNKPDQDSGSSLSSRVADGDATTHRPNGAAQQASRRTEDGIRSGELRAGSATDEHPVANRHRPRIPRPEVDPDQLLRSFQTGDPAVVYIEAQKLGLAYRDLVAELARTRFKLNFGTAVCTNCEGLCAGPNVLATCFQTKECHFTNLKDTSTKHLRVIDRLIKDAG